MVTEYSPEISSPRMGVHHVSSFSELIAARYTPEQSCFALLRGPLTGDFNALALRLDHDTKISAFGYKQLTRQELESYGSSTEGDEAKALEEVISDMESLHQEAPDRPAFLRVRAPFTGPEEDFMLHADGARTSFHFDQLLCNYNTPRTVWVCYDDAEVKAPEVRNGIPTNVGAFFEAKPGAPHYVFPLGTVWRHACNHRGMGNVRPFLHYAPMIKEGHVPRLNLAATVARLPGAHAF